MRIPRPSECIWIVGAAVAVVGMAVGGYLVWFEAVSSWGGEVDVYRALRALALVPVLSGLGVGHLQPS